MTKCRDPEIVLGCFTPNDPELSPITIEHVTLLSPEGITVATYYQDDTGSIIDPAVFMGGGELSLGSCDLGKTIQCLKDKFIEGGLDNTFTNFTHTNQVYTVTFDNGDTDTFTVPSATGWTDQVNQISAGLDSIMPWAQTVESFCNIAGGCGGLPAPFVELNKMVDRYTGFRVCPGDKIPVSVKYIADQTKKEKELVIQYVETDTIYIDRCVDCNGNEEFFVDGEIYVPVCAIPCEEEFPVTPTTNCQLIETIQVCVATLIQDSEDPLSYIPDLVESNIFLAFTQCGSVIDSGAYTLDGDGTPIPYELDPNNYFADCETLQPIEDPLPDCPEGAVFNPVQTGGHYFIWDNSTYDGLPVDHLQNGNNYEFTFAMDDGTSVIVQQTADPYFNNMLSVASATLGCTIIPVCANHTSPKGCNATHVANLAMYPAYDAPSAPADIQNNIANPDRNELWATGWLVDCSCGPKPLSVTITAANDATHVGATKTFKVHDKPKEIIYQAVTCDGVFYKDCDGNDIAAPDCCPEPYTPEACVKPTEDFVEVCYCASTLLNTGRGGITDPRNGPFTLGGISGDTWAEFETALVAAGYSSDFGTQFDDVGNPIQDASLWMVCGPNDLGALTYDSTLFEGGVTVDLTWAETKAQRVALSKCDKDFLTGLLTDCDACPISVVTDTVCSDVEEAFGEGKAAVIVLQGEPIIRKVITTYNLVNCQCVEATKTVKLFNFLNPLQEFVTEPVGNLTECDSDTEVLELCDRNGDPIQVVTITVNLPTGVEQSVQYADLDGVPVAQPLLPLGVCNPDVETIAACVTIKSVKVYGTIFAQMDGAGNPVISTSVFISNDSTITQQVGTSPYELNCEPCDTTCTETKTRYCYDVSAFAFICPTSTIVVDGEVVDLCGEDSGNGMIPSSGDLCTVGGVRSGQYSNAERCRSAYPQPTTDVVGAAMELQTQSSIGATSPSLNQYTNVHIAVRGTFPISGTAPSIDFSATWNVGSGIAVGAYDCSTNTDLDLIGGTLNTYDTGVCGVETTRGLNDSWGASNNGINHTATFDTSGVTDLQDVVFYTIVMGSPTEWLSDIQVNGLDPAAQSCDITSVQTLADTLTMVTGTPWTIEGESVCTETDAVLGALTCGETSVDPVVTLIETVVVSKRVQLDGCTLDALAAANPLNDVITDCDSSTELWYLLSKFRGTPDPHPDAASYGDTFVLISAEVRGEHPTVIDVGTGEPLVVSGYSLYAACASEKPSDDSNGHEWFQVADVQNTTFDYAGQVNPFPECAAGEVTKVLGTIGCLDQQILDKLCTLAERPLGIIESCDGSQFWTVNLDGTTNGPFANPSAKIAEEVKK